MGPADRAAPAVLRVQVAYSPKPQSVDLTDVALPPGAVLRDAVLASGVLTRHGLAPDQTGLSFGVWAKIRPLDHPLRDGDRVECYRPLQVDPKEARRQRYRKQGQAGRRARVAQPPAGSSTDPAADSAAKG